MKYPYAQIVLTVLLTAAAGVSQAELAQKLTPSHPLPGKEGMGMHHGMGMGGMMGGMSDEQRDQHLKGMQEHMLQMHDLSSQILAEKDPAKKEVLKKQQLDLMKAHHAQMMGKMMGGMHHNQAAPAPAAVPATPAPTK